MFVDRESGKGDEALPGSGLELDLDRRVCPDCSREAHPWEERCPDCDAATVPPEVAPAAEFRLPPFEDDDEAEAEAPAGSVDAGEDEPGARR